jgi:hypothetical protein
VIGVGGFIGGHFSLALLRLHDKGRVERPVRVLALVCNIARGRKQYDCSIDGLFKFGSVGPMAGIVDVLYFYRQEAALVKLCLP